MKVTLDAKEHSRLRVEPVEFTARTQAENFIAHFKKELDILWPEEPTK